VVKLEKVHKANGNNELMLVPCSMRVLSPVNLEKLLGMFPLIPGELKIYKFFKLVRDPKLVGMMPTTEVPYKPKSSRLYNAPRVLGMVPVSGFRSMYRPLRATMLDTTAGMVPTKELKNKVNTRRAVNCESDTGIYPEKRLPCKYIDSRFVRLPMVLGSVPARLLSLSTSSVSRVKLPIESGILPTRLFPDRCMVVIAPALQLTSLHPHFAPGADTQSQPTCVFKLVLAIKSHRALSSMTA
jgi:hypothetical protein